MFTLIQVPLDIRRNGNIDEIYNFMADEIYNFDSLNIKKFFLNHMYLLNSRTPYISTKKISTIVFVIK